MKPIKMSFILKLIALLILVPIILIWAYNYFSEKVFYLDDKTYSESSAESMITTYTTRLGEIIQITQYPDYKQLQINSEMYRIHENGSKDHEKTYLVTYPSGKTYTVKDVSNSGFLMAYDENGELVSGLTVYANSERILSPGEEYYPPSSLVSASYDKYHLQRGNVFLFIMSILIFGYSWCLFRIEAFQRLLFKISYGLWVVDPEPTEFYFSVTKLGAIAGMIMSVITLLISLK